MFGLRLSSAVGIASLAVAGLMLSSAPSFAAHHNHHRHHAQSGVTIYSDSDAYYDEDYDSVFPNTADHSAECINGYRWQRHNHDWYKTEAQDSIPLPCDD